MRIEIDTTPPTAHQEIHIALDFDGTLAHYESWDKQQNLLGKPVDSMVKRVKEWLTKGYKVSIFTARVSQPDAQNQIALIEKFLQENGLPILQITCMKMHYFTHIFDDRAYHVVKNAGIIVGMPNFNLK